MQQPRRNHSAKFKHGSGTPQLNASQISLGKESAIAIQCDCRQNKAVYPAQPEFRGRESPRLPLGRSFSIQ